MFALGYKGIGARFVAQLADYVVLWLIYVVTGHLFFGNLSWNAGGIAGVQVIGFNTLIMFVYFVALEGSVGATLGKKVAGIKVVREDGSRCGYGPALVRNILRIIDMLPLAYILGITLIMRSDKKQRLGDRVAGTVVINTRQNIAAEYARENRGAKSLRNSSPIR